MVFIVIGVMLLLYSVVNYKKAFLLYMLFEIIWFPNTKIIVLSGIPSIPLYLMTSFGFFVIYLLKKQKYEKYNSKLSICPFFYPLLFVTLSRFITCFFSVAGFFDEFPRALGYLFYNFLEVMIMWNIVETEDDFKFLIKGFVLIFFIAEIYGLVGYITQSNIVFEYKSSLTPEGLAEYYYGKDSERGYRLCSIFEHPIGAGMTFGLLSIFIIYLYFYKGKKYPYKCLAFITCTLGILCVILTKMRAGILFTIFASGIVIKMSNKKTYKIIILLLSILVITFPLYKNYLNIVLSIFDSNASSKVGGSNAQMRFEQLSASIELMKLSPIGGLGERFMVLIKNQYIDKILAMESFIFEELCKHGLVGLISTIYLVIISVFKIPYKFKVREIFWISFALWGIYTLTSIPFFRMNLYYIVVFYFIKNSQLYIESKIVKREEDL